MRSFIKPRKKKLFDDMTLLWLIFIGLMSIGLVIFGIYINYKSSFYIRMLTDKKQTNSHYIKSVKSLKQDIKIIDMEEEIAQEVKSSNMILKKSVKNLFDLVPDQISLTSITMKRDSLFLTGYTISKDSYTLLLEPPLKSIFDKSQVVFSKDNRGYIKFESKNSMNNKKRKK